MLLDHRCIPRIIDFDVGQLLNIEGYTNRCGFYGGAGPDVLLARSPDYTIFDAVALINRSNSSLSFFELVETFITICLIEA